MGAEISFCELRTKMVINVVDGKALGRIVDIIFSRENAKVAGVIVPGDKGFHLWNKKCEVFVPYNRIVRIGLDVVLVELRPAHFYKNVEQNCCYPEQSPHLISD